MSSILDSRSIPNRIDTNDIGLVFNGPSSEKSGPVLDARLRPACNYNKKGGAQPCCASEDFRESQIKADERACFKPLNVNEFDIRALLMHFIFSK